MADNTEAKTRTPARGAADRALAASEARYRMLADNATDIIACFGIDASFTFLSPSIRTILGYEPEELIGRSTRDIMHPDDYRRSVSAYRRRLAEGFAGEGFRFEYRAYHKDGRLVWLSGHPRAVFDPATGELTGFQDVVRDVTAHRALEAELRAARDEAQAAAAAKAEFMANMSHEIRTPLTAILGFTSLLAARPGLDGDATYQVGRIAAAGDALLAIVNDILDFSKLEAGLMPIASKPVAPQQVLADAVALFEPQAQAKGLTLAFDADALPGHVSLDPDRLRQVLLNLIGNAVKFTAKGVVAVSAAYDPARERLAVEVRDSGAGMDAEQQARLFQRFSQVDGAATRTGGGTGLGLAISRGLVEAMGGEIGLASTPGIGSVFRFEIPAPACAAPNASTAIGVPAGIAGLRVLLADDNAANREIARSVLETFEVEVTDVADGAEAVELAAVLPYDVILLDIRMPGMDGPTAARRIRAEPGPNRQTAILAFSANHELDGDAASLFDGHVLKPIEVAPLLMALSDAAAWEDRLAEAG